MFLTCYRSVDCHIRRYDIRVGKMTADYTGHPVTSVTLSKDGQCILASSLDNTVRLLDKETGELLNEYAAYLVFLYLVKFVVSSGIRIRIGSESYPIKVREIFL